MKSVTSVSEAMSQLRASISSSMDERVVDIVNASIQNSIAVQTGNVTFRLNDSYDSTQIINFLIVAGYENVEHELVANTTLIEYKFVIPLVKV